MIEDDATGPLARGRLPEGANLEYLKNRAKDELEQLRRSEPAAKLTTAQYRLARAYGFRSWRDLRSALKAGDSPSAPHVRRSDLERYTGLYDLGGDVVTVTQAGGSLFVQTGTGAALEFTALDDGRFVNPQTKLQCSFIHASDGSASDVIQHPFDPRMSDPVRDPDHPGPRRSFERSAKRVGRTEADELRKKVRCAFCKKCSDDVAKIVAGPSIAICNECIELCSSVINTPPLPMERPSTD